MASTGLGKGHYCTCRTGVRQLGSLGGGRAGPCGQHQDGVRGVGEAEDLARRFLDEVGIGKLRGEKCHVARELGAHDLEAANLELQEL